MSPSPDTELRPSGGDATRKALEAVLREQARRTERAAQSKVEARKPRSGSAKLLVAALVLAAVSVAIWSSPPAWAQPEPFPEPGPQRIEAGLRMEMWVAVQRIRGFQEERRRLPVLLWEAVADPSDRIDLQYQRLSEDVFRLVGRREGLQIVYDSTTPAEGLAAPAQAILGEGSEG